MIRKTPPKKATMPRNRSFLVKNRNVRLIPIVIVSPTRNRMSPIANNAESKKKTIPRNRKTHPYFGRSGARIICKTDSKKVIISQQCTRSNFHLIVSIGGKIPAKLDQSYQKQKPRSYFCIIANHF